MAKILIIDDDPALRELLGKTLRRIGHGTAEASDGEEALRLFREGGFHLVVTDLIMPGKEGIETILELRERSSQIPILVISGGLAVDRRGPLEDAQALGASAALAKPFSLEEFLGAVRALLPEPEADSWA